MELAECVVYADIVMDGSKESVNYVYCAMHYNKFATVETSSKIQKAAKKTYQLFVFCCCVLLCTGSMCSQVQNITKIGKTYRKIKSKKSKHSKCLLVRVTCPRN